MSERGGIMHLTSIDAASTMRFPSETSVSIPKCQVLYWEPCFHASFDSGLTRLFLLGGSTITVTIPPIEFEKAYCECA